jgi:hypothetical protein
MASHVSWHGWRTDRKMYLLDITMAEPHGERALTLRANVKPERWQYPPQPDVFKEVLREAITQRLQRAQEINNAVLGREIQEGLKVLLTPPPRVRRSTMSSTTASRDKQGAVVKGHSRGREGGRRPGPRRKQQVPVRRKQNGLLGVQGGLCQRMLGKWRKKQRCGRCHSARARAPPPPPLCTDVPLRSISLLVHVLALLN